MRIYLSDATYKHTIALARYLKAFDSSLKVVGISSYKPFGEKFYSRCYDDWIIGDFVEKVQTEKPQLAIPVSNTAVEKACKANLAGCSLPSLASLEIALDKAKTLQLAESLSIPVPKTLSKYDLEFLPDLSIRYPCVVKGSLEAGKNIVSYPKNPTELNLAIKSALDDSTQKGALPLIQEYVTGTGLGFFAFYQKGELKRFYMHQRLREYPITGGASTAAETVYHEKAFKHGKKLLDALKWNGPAMVEFKYDPQTDKLALMEINPKFWGSTELGLAAGVNFGELLVKDNQGEDLIPNLSPDQYKKIKFFWPFDGDLFSIAQSKKFNVFKEYFSKGYQTNLKTAGAMVCLIRLFRQLVRKRK